MTSQKCAKTNSLTIAFVSNASDIIIGAMLKISSKFKRLRHRDVESLKILYY